VEVTPEEIDRIAGISCSAASTHWMSWEPTT